MDILTYEMDSKQCEGWWGDFVWYDEPPPRTHRVATLRGLTDRLGWEIFTLTPLDQPWLFDEIWENSNPDIETFLMDIRHNLMRQNPKTGKYVGISEKAIERFESVLTDEEKQVRRHGRFTHLAGRIFKGWDRKVHLFNRRDMWTVEGTGSKIDGEPPAHWPRMMLIDPHDRKPDCVIWVTKDPDYGTKYIYRELMNKNSDATFKTTCRDIRDKEVDGRDTVMYRIMDPNFGPKRQGNSGMDVRKTFEAESQNIGYPMRFTFGDDHKELGRKAVNELFWYDKEMPISIINQPGLLIADDCVNCIYQIEHYVWDEYKLGAMEKDVKEKPKDLNTDFPDLLHYMALYNWRDNPAEVSPGCGNAYGGN